MINKSWVLSLVLLASVSARAESTLVNLAAAARQDTRDLTAVVALAEEAAQKLAAGGQIWAAGQPGFVRELVMRAGGLMMIEPLEKKDGVWGIDRNWNYRSQNPAKPIEFNRRIQRQLKKGDVILFAPGAKYAFPEELKGDYLTSTIFFGGDLYASRSIHSSAKSHRVSETMGQVLSGFVFTGELIAAMTRIGDGSKIPLIYQSVGEFGGFFRMDYTYWTEQLYYQPGQYKGGKIERGVLGSRYAEALGRILTEVRTTQWEKIVQTGRRAAATVASGKQAMLYFMGHIFPSEVMDTEIGKFFKGANSDSGRPFGDPLIHDGDYHLVDHNIGEGDLVVHVGYQHFPEELLDYLTARKASLVYVSLYSPGPMPGAVHIDPRWPWSDAVLKVQGLDLRILAVSGLVNASIAWDIFDQAKRASR